MKHENYNVGKLNFIEFPNTGVEIVPAPAVANASYNYKFGNKELQEELGLNMYDFGARNYDPAIGRWMNIDPLAEKYFDNSAYTYTMNNPIFFIDPNGKEVDVSALADSKNKEDDQLLKELMISLADISGMTVTKSTDKNGKTTLSGTKDDKNKDYSSSASAYVSHLLTMKETITVNSSDNGSGAFRNGEVNLDLAQIQGMQKGLEKKGIDKDVMSVGLAFLHETMHTVAGANWWKKPKSESQKDTFDRFTDSGEGAGNVDNRTNVFRQQLSLPTLYQYGTDSTLYILVKGKKVEVPYSK